MNLSHENQILRMENRIAKLKTNPVENQNLLRKATRQLRKLKG